MYKQKCKIFISFFIIISFLLLKNTVYADNYDSIFKITNPKIKEKEVLNRRIRIIHPKSGNVIRSTKETFIWQRAANSPDVNRLVISYKANGSTKQTIRKIPINNKKSRQLVDNLPKNTVINVSLWGEINIPSPMRIRPKDVKLAESTYLVGGTKIRLDNTDSASNILNIISPRKYQQNDGIKFQWSTLEALSKKEYHSKYSLYIGSSQSSKSDIYKKEDIYPSSKIRIIETPKQDNPRPPINPRNPIPIDPRVPINPRAPINLNTINSISFGNTRNLTIPSFGASNKSSRPFISLENPKIVHTVFKKDLQKKLQLGQTFYVTLVTYAKDSSGNYYKYDISSKRYKMFSYPKISDFRFLDNSTIGKFTITDADESKSMLEIGTENNNTYNLYSQAVNKSGEVKVRNLYNRGEDIYVRLSGSIGGYNYSETKTYRTSKDSFASRRNCGSDYGNKYSGSFRKFFNLELNSNFSDINNYLMMQASAKTYRRQMARRNNRDFKCSVEELYNHWGFSKVSFYDNANDGTNAIIASNDDAVIIAIRGTEEPFNTNNLDYDLADMRTNIALPFIDVLGSSSPSKAHKGFANAGKSLANSLSNSLLSQHNAKDKEIFITGHSLGGAVSIMTTFYLDQYSDYHVTANYAFAAPEVGNLAFTNYLKRLSTIYTTINYRDPIPYSVRRPTSIFIGSNDDTGVQHGALGAFYAPSLAASKQTTFFDKNHDATHFPSPPLPYFQISRTILNFNPDSRLGGLENGIDLRTPHQPYAFITVRDGATVMSSEWHFHHVNFYLASSYKVIKDDRFGIKNHTSIQPEFEKASMCIKRSGSSSMTDIGWTGTDVYDTILSDRQSYPFKPCH